MNSEIVESARSFLKTPYLHQGRDPAVGLDCAGLIARVMESLDLPYKDLKGYPRTPYDGMLQSVLDDQPRMRRTNELVSGAVLLLRIRKDPQHVAIYTGNSIIHALQAVGEVTEHRFDDRWRQRIVQAYEIHE